MVIKYLIEKEFKQFFRNKLMPRLAIVFPIAVILIFPWATTMDIKGVNVSVVDNDYSTTSRRLVDKIGNSTYFQLQNVAPTYGDAMDDIENELSDIVLEIPVDFERNLVRNSTAEVKISANAINGVKGGLGSGYLSAIMVDFSKEIMAHSGAQLKSPVNISIKNEYNQYLDYKLFMVPALVTIVVIMLCGFFPTFNIVGEKEVGTIEQISVTPISKLSFILAKLIPYWLMGLVVLSISFVLSYFIYGLVPLGSFWTIYLAAALFILVMSGIGLVISNYSSTMQQSMFVMFFFVMIFVLMSGLMTPVQSMPDWAQGVAIVNPPRFFIDIMRSAYLKGSGVMDNGFNFLMLAIFALVINLWAVASYHKRS